MTHYNPRTQELATRHVGDVAETVTGQLSYCIHMMNCYQEVIDTTGDQEAIQWLTEVYHRLGRAQEHVASMVEAHQYEQEVRRYHRRTEQLRQRERVR